MGYVAEFGDLLVQGMADLVDGSLFRFGEVACLGVEGVFLKEEPDFVAGGEEVVVADVFFCG